MGTKEVPALTRGRTGPGKKKAIGVVSGTNETRGIYEKRGEENGGAPHAVTSTKPCKRGRLHPGQGNPLKSEKEKERPGGGLWLRRKNCRPGNLGRQERWYNNAGFKVVATGESNPERQTL